jgi:hypothetical protein
MLNLEVSILVRARLFHRSDYCRDVHLYRILESTRCAMLSAGMYQRWDAASQCVDVCTALLELKFSRQ